MDSNSTGQKSTLGGGTYDDIKYTGKRNGYYQKVAVSGDGKTMIGTKDNGGGRLNLAAKDENGDWINQVGNTVLNNVCLQKFMKSKTN